MGLFEAGILGLVQGLTEFLPISSSGHLVVLPNIFGLEDHSLLFDVTLHLGTSLALLIYFWKDLLSILRFPRKWWLKIFLGILPAGLFGFLFNDLFENYFRGLSFVILFLFLGTILMFFAEKFFSKSKTNTLTSGKSFKIGLFQVLALFPGFSRSGATISGGMILGLSREDAARFSFLLSIPLVWAAAAYEFIKIFPVTSSSLDLTPLLVGGLTSFISGFLCIKFFMNFVKEQSLIPFVLYRMVLVLFLVSFTLFF